MILKFPTAYFVSVLPQQPSDVGNVTYTCSGDSPPRPNVTAIQITAALAARKRPPLLLTDWERRDTRGQRLFTVSSSGPSGPAAGTLQYEVGEVLDFVTGIPLVIDPALVQPELQIRHDTNLLDLVSMGLSADEIGQLQKDAFDTHAALTASLNALIAQHADLEMQITDNQKALNETTKALEAANAIAKITPVDSIIAKLTARQVELNAAITQGVTDINAVVVEMQDVRNQLLQVVQLVR